MSISKILQNLCQKALNSNFSNQELPIAEITLSTQKQFGHFQCNSAMKLTKILKLPPREIAEKIKIYLIENNKQMFENIEIAGPGFVNITLTKEFIAKYLNNIIIDPHLSIDDSEKHKKQKVIIDFSSPNIAKEMHVGHLRSTIIGDSLARIFEFLDYNVLRLNHLGDWGTQFGMLIAYIKTENISTDNLNLSNLVDFYKKSKQKFDEDEEFKIKSQQYVVKLQSGDKEILKIWQEICEISKIAYSEIYNILDVKITDRGESFYNNMLANIVSDLEDKNLLTISDSAKCVILDGFKNREGDPLPLIVQKSDGGFNYATTDLAGIKHRVTEENATRIIYVTDAGQAQHFNMVFQAAAKAGYYNPKETEINHVPFGLVLRDDGKKFKTRSGDTEKLIDLLNTAIARAKFLLSERHPDLEHEELSKMSQILGINAIKYADLSNNRTSNYAFSYEKMLQFEGNTAANLCYAYVRIKSIQKKSKNNISDLKKYSHIKLIDETEVDLGLHACMFNEVLVSCANELMPHKLADYLYKLAMKFHSFFHECRVIDNEYEASRLLLCEAVSEILAKGLELLGLKLLDKM